MAGQLARLLRWFFEIGVRTLKCAKMRSGSHSSSGMAMGATHAGMRLRFALPGASFMN
jgi:hypothetical protein